MEHIIPIVSQNSGRSTRRALLLENTEVEDTAVAPKMVYPTKESVFSFTPPGGGGVGFNNNPPSGGGGVVINVNQTTGGGGSGGPPAWIYVALAVVSLAGYEFLLI